MLGVSTGLNACLCGLAIVSRSIEAVTNIIGGHWPESLMDVSGCCYFDVNVGVSIP
jgi:hypothetical protein